MNKGPEDKGLTKGPRPLVPIVMPLQMPGIEVLKNLNMIGIDCLWIVTHIRHAPYGRRHVVPSAVSLADVYASPALAGV